jgi:peptidoglycan/xylan/chitin deacetylase (PgdA/CDA1 family)
MRTLVLFVVFTVILSGCMADSKESKGSPEKSTAIKQGVQTHPLTNKEGQINRNAKASKIENINYSADKALKKDWIYLKGSPSTKKVAITFDDGPDYYYTVKILDILKRENVPATFFVVGKNAKKYPEVLKRMYREGHLIGNHSWNHSDFSKLTLDQVKEEISQTEQLFQEHLHITPTFVRPPFGAMNDQLRDYIEQSPYTVIHWSIDTKDWTEKPAQEIMKVVQKELNAGDILLFHSAGGGQSLQGTVDVLPQVIEYIRQQGLEPVTVDQLIQIPAYQRSSLQ